MEKFETNEEMIYSLIIDDLEQTISAADKKILEKWRNAAEANEQTYRDFADVQLNMDKLFDKHGFDPQLSWESLDQKISVEVKSEHQGLGIWYKIAAAVLVTLAVGYYFLGNDRYEVVVNAETAAVSHLVLPDGTQLSLNAGTTIKYDKSNFNTDRKLILEKGEIFVHVIRHNSSQFRIELGEVTARDIGTSFNVLRTGKDVSVIVEEGKVAVTQQAKSNEVMLNPGMKGVYNDQEQELSSMPNPDQNYKAWIDKKFTFREMPVEQVALQLQKVYKIPVHIEGNELKLRKLTAKLHYQTLDSVLKVISASLQCKVVKEQNSYVLSAIK